jgi:uncharacterized protein YqjF (DUF2071 family)
MSGVEQPADEPVERVAPPLPRPAFMRQRWRDVAFVHWAVEPEQVAGLMPPDVRPDIYDGHTYVGLVPFRVVDGGPPRGPALPWVGRFLETNVRLYSVDRHGRRGVVFLSLDAERLPLVVGARAGLALPYRWGRLRHSSRPVSGGEEHTYETRLRHPGAWGAGRRVVVRPGERVAGSDLDEFLTARWRLHVAHLGQTWFVPVEHQPWPLHAAEVTGMEDQLLATVRLGELAGRAPDHVAFSPGVDTLVGVPGRVRRPH